MAVNVAVLLGSRDLSTILLVFASTATVMPFGLCLELLRDSKYYLLVTLLSWGGFFVGTLSSWVVTLSYDPISQIPIVAWASITLITIAFNSFGWWSLATRCVSKSRLEKGYYLLSLVSKVILFGFVMWGGASSADWMRKQITCVPPLLNTTSLNITSSPSPSTGDYSGINYMTQTATETPTPTASLSTGATPSKTPSISITPTPTVTVPSKR